MLDRGIVYSHSGRLGNGLILIPVIGLLAAAVLGVVYAVVDVYLPVAGYISFVLTAAFAGGVGYSLSRTAVVAKCRSVGFVQTTGFLIGLFALYISWVAFEYVLIRRSLPPGEAIDPFRLLLAPSAVWEIAKGINVTGWYAISGGQVKGNTLWTFWAMEAVIVVIGAGVLASSGIKDRVFCERCARWCSRIKDRMRLAVSPDESVYHRLAEGDLKSLADLPVVPWTVTPYLRVDLHSCEGCLDTSTWQVSLVTHERDKKGQLQQKDRAISPRRLMTSAQREEIDRLAERPAVEVNLAEPDAPGGAT
jgi:hypothetical protein